MFCLLCCLFLAFVGLLLSVVAGCSLGFWVFCEDIGSGMVVRALCAFLGGGRRRFFILWVGWAGFFGFLLRA